MPGYGELCQAAGALPVAAPGGHLGQGLWGLLVALGDSRATGVAGETL